MTDIWVCSNCHSINRQRTGRCYKCHAEQATSATGEMATLRQEQAIATRAVVGYRPAGALGICAAIFLIGLAAVSAAAVVESQQVTQFISGQLDVLEKTGTFDEAALAEKANAGAVIALVQIAIIVPLLLFFGAWLGRVVANVPALGGGLPGTSPGRAFVNTLIPVVNLKTVPGMIQDVLYRLDPKGGGLFMVMIAWVGLVGSWIVSVVGGRYLSLRVTFDIANAESLKDAVESVRTLLNAAFALDVVTGTLIAVGALVLVIIMIRIERRSHARDREIRAVAGV